jgi:hypothetical protein
MPDLAPPQTPKLLGVGRCVQPKVVTCAEAAQDMCDRRIQRDLHKHCGGADAPQCSGSPDTSQRTQTAHEHQKARLDSLFAKDRHVGVEVTWPLPSQDHLTANPWQSVAGLPPPFLKIEPAVQ